MTAFKFDAAQSESNRAKHGIDFVAAQSLWNDPMLLEIPAKKQDEPRLLVIGQMDGSTLMKVKGLRHHSPAPFFSSQRKAPDTSLNSSSARAAMAG